MLLSRAPQRNLLVRGVLCCDGHCQAAVLFSLLDRTDGTPQTTCTAAKNMHCRDLERSVLCPAKPCGVRD